MRYRNRALWTTLFAKRGEQTLAQWLEANYENWIRLKDPIAGGKIRTIAGVGDDTLQAGDTEKVAGRWWINSAGYADVSETALTMNSKSYPFSSIPNATDLSTTAAYIGQFYVDANNLINIRFSTTANQLIAEYIGQSVSETITASNLIADKVYDGLLVVPGATSDAKLYLNGLLRGAVTLANAISGTDIDNVNSAIAASDTSGTNKLNGRGGEIQVTDDELSDYNARKISLRAMGYADPLSHHNAYAVQGDGSSAYLTVSAASEINNIFDGGGTAVWEGVIEPPIGSPDILMDKVKWSLYTIDVSGNNTGIRFGYVRSGGTSSWKTTSALIDANEPIRIELSYNGDNSANDPTIKIEQGGSIQTLTIGSGLTLVARATGTRTSDASDNLGILANPAGLLHLLASLYQVALFNSTNISITALGQDWSSLNPDWYIKCGDFIDATNIDSIDTAGSGTIYDASGNGNDATPTNMTHTNLIETRPTSYTAYLANVDSVANWDLTYIGYGSKLRVYGDSATIGTNTSNNGYDYLGLQRIAFGKTANSYADMYNGGSGQLTGTIPGTMTMRFRAVFDNNADNAVNVICRIEADANNYYELKKNASNQIEFVHTEAGNSVSLTHGIGSDVGIHDYEVTITADEIILYYDGSSVASDDSDTGTMTGNAPTGSIALAIIGADTLTPTNEADADILEAWFDTNTAHTATQVSQTHSQLGR